MPVQTTRTSYIQFPDGAKVSVKGYGDADFYDLGAIGSSITNTLNYTESTYETANAGKLDKKITDMTIDGGFTLVNLDPVGITRLGSNMFTHTKTNGTPITDMTEQKIAANWSKNTLYALTFSRNVRAASKPTITVTPKGTTALTEDTDFVVVSSDAPSGYSVVFITDTNASKELTIAFTSVTPIASDVIHAGSSSIILKPMAIRIAHTDSNNKVRSLDLYAVDVNSGGFQFNFKGANEDGVEEMPITYTGKLDTSRIDQDQLFSYCVEQ